MSAATTFWGLLPFWFSGCSSQCRALRCWICDPGRLRIFARERVTACFSLACLPRLRRDQVLDLMSSAALDADEFRIALLIGQQDYQDEKFGKLDYCHRDIEEVASMLDRFCGFKPVRPFKNAVNNDGHNDFLTLQKWLVQEIKPAKRVLVLVYYAGHAVSIGGQSYFIPVDAKIGEVGKYFNVWEFLQPLHDLISAKNPSCAQRTAAELSAEPVPGAVGLLSWMDAGMVQEFRERVICRRWCTN